MVVLFDGMHSVNKTYFGSLHILYNADGVVFCYIVLYMGGGFDFCYITLLKFLTLCHFLTFNSTFNNFTAVFCFSVMLLKLLNFLTDSVNKN